MTRRKTVGRFLLWAAAQNTDECIPWPYGKGANGYGTAGFLGEKTSAHRAVLILRTGVLPSLGMEAAHDPITCKERSCVNPAHLRWASRVDNILDKKVSGTELSGELNCQAKLTERDVIMIREDKRSERVVAKEYGVSKSTVGRVRRREMWAHVAERGRS